MRAHVQLAIRPRRMVYDIAQIRRQIKEPVARRALAWIRAEAPDGLAKLARQRGWGALDAPTEIQASMERASTNESKTS